MASVLQMLQNVNMGASFYCTNISEKQAHRRPSRRQTPSSSVAVLYRRTDTASPVTPATYPVWYEPTYAGKKSGLF